MKLLRLAADITMFYLEESHAYVFFIGVLIGLLIASVVAFWL